MSWLLSGTEIIAGSALFIAGIFIVIVAGGGAATKQRVMVFPLVVLTLVVVGAAMVLNGLRII